VREDPAILGSYARALLSFYVYDAEKQSAVADMELGFDLEEYKRCVWILVLDIILSQCITGISFPFAVE
jgi:hypothetical protein